MALSIGIVGLPNVGKSTLFNALTGAGALAANYPFATIDSNTGIVPIPDPRVESLAELLGSREAIEATVTFVDIAGLVEGANRGEGLGNQFLGQIRDVNAICHVVRAFSADNVVHVTEEVDPRGDITTIETELGLADLETIDRRLPKLQKEATADRGLMGQAESLGEIRTAVDDGVRLSSDSALSAFAADIEGLHLLTAKPVIYVFNCDQETLADPDRCADLAALVEPSAAIFLDAQFESELTDLDEADRREMLEAMGHGESGLHQVIRAAYDTLGLQSFLTGNDEAARAWTVHKGATALEAAGVIHTDFQRGFIAAEVISFPELNQAGSWAEARRRGLVRTEGKAYVMHPDDVVEFRFNV